MSPEVVVLLPLVPVVSAVVVLAFAPAESMLASVNQNPPLLFFWRQPVIVVSFESYCSFGRVDCANNGITPMIDAAHTARIVLCIHPPGKLWFVFFSADIVPSTYGRARSRRLNRNYTALETQALICASEP